MSVVLFLMGSSLVLNKFRSIGYKPLLFGVSLWVFIATASALLIIEFF